MYYQKYIEAAELCTSPETMSSKSEMINDRNDESWRARKTHGQSPRNHGRFTASAPVVITLTYPLLAHTMEQRKVHFILLIFARTAFPGNQFVFKEGDRGGGLYSAERKFSEWL